jgi:hypothetical protein
MWGTCEQVCSVLQLYGFVQNAHRYYRAARHASATILILLALRATSVQLAGITVNARNQYAPSHAISMVVYVLDQTCVPVTLAFISQLAKVCNFTVFLKQKMHISNILFEIL